jgi:hypothetical protein
MYERDYESVTTSPPYFAATSLISQSYTVLKTNGGEIPLKNYNHTNPFYIKYL